MRFFETLNYTGLGNRLYWPPSMVTSSLNTEAASIASNPRGLAQDRQQYLVSNPKSLSVEKRTTICEELLKQIYEKAKFLRSLKTSPSSLNSSGDNISSTSSSSSSSSSSSGGVPRAARVPTKSEVIFELLELKYLYCLLNPVPVTDEQLLVDTEPKKTIKIRWSFVDPETKEETRLQYQFHNTVRIPMREVLKALRAQTTKQLDFNGGFAKIELVEKHYKILESADGVKNTTFKLTKKTYQALNLDDCILMPLKKPGPVLGVNESIELRVTWHAVVNPRTLPVELLKSGSRIVEKMIDTGVNFFDPSFGSTLPKLIDDAFASSVHQMIALSTNLETSKFSLELAKNRVGSVFATVGVHPSEASELPFETESEKLLALLKEGGVIGVGECGIKRTETTTEDDLEKQKQWFRFQVKTAQQLGLPLFLNEQNGFDVLFQIIKEEARASQRDTLSVPALVNCFNSSEEALESYLSMGFYIGVTGLLCNDARNQNLLPLISKIPLDRLVVSTDAPYLTPFTMPKPFPKQNQPSLLAHVVIKIADVLGVHPSVIARNSTQNAQRFLNLPEILFDGNLHSLDEGIDLNPIVSYYGPRHAKKGDADVKKPEAEASDNKDDKKVEAKPVEYPFPTFEFAGAVYRCTEKEKRLLDHQKERSNVEALRQLIADLELSPL